MRREPNSEISLRLMPESSRTLFPLSLSNLSKLAAPGVPFHTMRHKGLRYFSDHDDIYVFVIEVPGIGLTRTEASI
jgi:hypothetical protein